MVCAQTTICNKLGLHARAATKLAKLANRFASRISLRTPTRTTDAKSVMALMLLAASRGTAIEVEAEGEDECEALQAVITLIEDRFGEAE